MRGVLQPSVGVATTDCTNSHWMQLKNTMTTFPDDSTYRIARRAGEQGARFPMENQVGSEKYATGLKNCLLKGRKTSLISTFNARTLQGGCKLFELASIAESLGIEVICIQEHRQYHDDVTCKTHDIGKGWKLFTSSATKNESNATIGGVGLLISPNACKALNSVEPINSRTVIATFNGNPLTTVISCYSPTNTSEDIVAEEFYSGLSTLIKQVPKHNVIIVGGDMNAKIGKENCKGTPYHETTNRNGQLLLDVINECNLVNLSTRYCKRIGKLWTFTYPNGTKAQLDHILINKKWKNSALNCEAYNTFYAIGSDHRPATAKIRLSLRANIVRKTKKAPYDWTKLLEDENVKREYTIEVSNRFQALQDLCVNDTADSTYNNIIEAHKKTAETHIPLKPKHKQRVPWENYRVTEKRQKLKDQLSIKCANPTQDNIDKVEISKKELDQAYEAEQEKYIEEKISVIENAHANQKSRLAWATINEVSGRKKTNTGQIRAATHEGRVNMWKEHFQKLLGEDPIVDDKPILKVFDTLPIETDEFTMDELKHSIKALKNNKAPGLDEIPAEVWKTQCFDQELLEICNKTYQGDAPNTWRKGGILPFPKKGDLGLTTNYRGITLTAVASKIYNKMLLNRIRPHVDPLLRNNQNGFRASRSTTAQILALRRLIEGVKARNLPAVLTFIDFRKAFDSIHRGKLMDILLAYGIPKLIVSAIQVLYTDTFAKVLSPDGDTEEFEIRAGVLQGDTLAPFLFIIALDYAMRKATKDTQSIGFTLTQSRSRRYPATFVTDADFADDLALTSQTIEQAQLFLLRVESAAAELGLYTNEDKTKYMSFNQHDGYLVTLNGSKLKRVNDFIYLGSWVYSSEKDINVRIAKAWAALSKMDCIWKSNMNRKLKISFFRATVETVLLYGCTTWTLTKGLERKLDGTYTRLLRAVLNISWKSHTTNNMLYGNLSKVSNTIRERRLQFSGHCWRSKGEIVPQLLLWEPSHGKRSRGRPAKTYLDQLVEDTGLAKEDLPKMMDDRVIWRQVVSSVRSRTMR